MRDHWAVENSLHWVMDMTFRDDECRIRTENAPENFVTLKHMAANLARRKKGNRPRSASPSKPPHGMTIISPNSSQHNFLRPIPLGGLEVAKAMDIVLGLALGVLVLAGVAYFALRAGEKPLRKRDSTHDYVAPYWTGDSGGPGSAGG